MTALDRLRAAAAREALAVCDVVAPEPGEGAPPWARSLALLSPDGPRFWAHFAASPEYASDAPDPLDRWSRRVVGALAAEVGGAALFPFDGPPWPPFPLWARRAGRAWPSPLGMLVHAERGLWISFRGAVALGRAAAASPHRRRRPAPPAPRPAASPVRSAPLPEPATTPPPAAPIWTAPRARRAATPAVSRAAPARSAPTMRPAPLQAAFHLRAFRI
jgi:epoxyqueuosine reductase